MHTCGFPHDVSRNNADLGKGVPRQHVSMKPGNSSFLAASLRCFYSPPFLYYPHHNLESASSAAKAVIRRRSWASHRDPSVVATSSCCCVAFLSGRPESTLPAAVFSNGECESDRGCVRLFEEVAALPPRWLRIRFMLDPLGSAGNSSDSRTSDRFSQPRRHAGGTERTGI